MEMEHFARDQPTGWMSFPKFYRGNKFGKSSPLHQSLWLAVQADRVLEAIPSRIAKVHQPPAIRILIASGV
jgi:hypothetical protein